MIDEFPYPVKTGPQPLSIVQAALAPGRAEFTASRSPLLLCGSSMSFMDSLPSGSAPLCDRSGIELVVPHTHFRPRRRVLGIVLGIDDPRLAFELNSVVGGAPAATGGSPPTFPPHSTISTCGCCIIR